MLYVSFAYTVVVGLKCGSFVWLKFHAGVVDASYGN
jgi:hypothetical protein